MSRQGSGVEVRANSIRLTFVEGKPTLRRNGEPLRPTKANVDYAHRLAREIRAKMEAGTFSFAEYFPADGGSIGAPLTLEKHLQAWLATLRLEASTLQSNRSAAQFWATVVPKEQSTPLGPRPLRSIKHSDVRAALAGRPDLAAKTVRNYLGVLGRALALAVRDNLISEDPSTDVPRAKGKDEEPDPFTHAEAEDIIAAMRARYPEPVANMVEFWFFSGLRTGELAGLRWESVDFRSGRVRVERAIVAGQEQDYTKTKRWRDVILNSRALAALKRQRAHSQVAGAHVWLDTEGQPWMREQNFRRRHWSPTLARLGIRYRRPYNCRHTFATMMLMAGRPDAWCADQLGHSVQVFHRHYAKWLRDGVQDSRQLAGFEAWLTAQGASDAATKGGSK